MNKKVKSIVTLLIAITILSVGMFSSIAYAGNGSRGSETRDRECIEEPKRLYCDREECDRDKLQLRIRDCINDCVCKYDCECDRDRLHLWLSEYDYDDLEDLIDAIEDIKELEEKLEKAKDDRNYDKIEYLKSKIEEARLEIEEMLELIKKEAEVDYDIVKEQHRYRQSNRKINQQRFKLDLIEFLEKEYN